MPQIASRMTHCFFKKDELIIKQGDDGDRMYVLLKGKAGVLVKDNIVAYISENKQMGEKALENDAKRNASILAVEDCYCLLLMKNDYIMIIEDYKKVEKQHNIDFL